ncbi:MAG: DUF4440 domain-containing protein [Bryobacteraceae bacterium]
MASKLSDAQREVWNLELRYWHTRTSGKLEEHMSLWHDEVAAWGSMLDAPGTKADMRNNVAGILQDTRPGSYTCDLEPFSIRVEEDFAFVFYRTHEVRTDLAGDRREARVRIIHTWWRTPQGWQIIAGMGAAVVRAG